MIKYFIILLVIAYVFRRIIFMPIAPPKKPDEQENKGKKGFTNKVGDYTDYEEIK